jgi:hypothetical protein
LDCNFLLRFLHGPFPPFPLPNLRQSGRKIGREAGGKVKSGLGRNKAVGFTVISTNDGEDDTEGINETVGAKDKLGGAVLEVGINDTDGDSDGGTDGIVDGFSLGVEDGESVVPVG